MKKQKITPQKINLILELILSSGFLILALMLAVLHVWIEEIELKYIGGALLIAIVFCPFFKFPGWLKTTVAIGAVFFT